MDDPVTEIPLLLQHLTTSPPLHLAHLLRTYYHPTATFSHPLARIDSPLPRPSLPPLPSLPAIPTIFSRIGIPFKHLLFHPPPPSNERKGQKKLTQREPQPQPQQQQPPVILATTRTLILALWRCWRALYPGVSLGVNAVTFDANCGPPGGGKKEGRVFVDVTLRMETSFLSLPLPLPYGWGRRRREVGGCIIFFVARTQEGQVEGDGDGKGEGKEKEKVKGKWIITRQVDLIPIDQVVGLVPWLPGVGTIITILSHIFTLLAFLVWKLAGEMGMGWVEEVDHQQCGACKTLANGTTVGMGNGNSEVKGDRGGGEDKDRDRGRGRGRGML